MSAFGRSPTDFSGEASEFQEQGYITRFLGDLTYKQRENDYQLRQLEDKQAELITKQALQEHQEAMERQKDMSPEQAAELQRQAQEQNQGLWNDLEGFSRQSEQRMADLQAWFNGYIGTIWTGTSLDYVAGTPMPGLDYNPVYQPQDILPEPTALQPEAPEYINGFGELQNILTQMQAEINSPSGGDLTALVGDFQDTLNGLLKELNGETTPDGTEGIRETVDYTEAAAEGLRMIFTPEVVNNWERMSMQQRCDCLGEYTGYLCRVLGVDVSQVVLQEMDSDSYGYFCDYNDTIVLNERMVENPENLGRLLDTLIHETRHGFQHEAVDNPERFDIPRETIEQWRQNFDNYVRPEYDLQGYWEQPVERDARGYAADVMQTAGINVPVWDGVASVGLH